MALIGTNGQGIGSRYIEVELRTIREDPIQYN